MLKQIILSITTAGVIMAANVEIGKDSKDLRLTIYNSNLAFVSELRSAKIPAGDSNLIYEGVSARVIPESVINNLNNDILLYSQNYNFNLFSFDSMLKSNIGEEVDYRIENQLFSGTLLSENPVMIKDNNKVVVLKEPSQVIFKKIPTELKTEPSFTWRINTKKEVQKDISLKYLTTGLSWNSNYVVSLNDNTLDLSGWITVTNDSGVTYNNANLTFLAGEVKQERPQQIRMAKTMELAAVDSFEVKEESFSGYHIYKIPFKETLKNKEKKQISFISKNDIKYENYGYALIDINSNYTGEKNIQFNNTVEIEKVDMPLPAGIIRAYKKDSSGQDNFIGESRIQNTPKNEKIKIEIGKLFDITGIQKVLKFNQRHNIQEVMLETTIKNNGTHTQRLVFDIVSNRYASIKNYNDSCAIKNKKCIVSDQNAWTKRFEITLNAGEVYKFISEYEIHN